jgi:chitin disaccharide deacetylase
MLLIINADDLGTSEDVNEQIFALIAAGRVTSASIIANGPAFAHAAAHARRFPRCSFGAHLNLTEYAPLSRTSGLRAILDERGLLSRKPHDIRFDRHLRVAARLELATQVRRALDAGIPVKSSTASRSVSSI